MSQEQQCDKRGELIEQICRSRCEHCSEGYPYTPKSKADGTYLFHALGEYQLPCEVRDIRTLGDAFMVSHALPIGEPGRIPELEPTRRNAEYWSTIAHEQGNINEKLLAMEQAINAWKNAAYAAWDKINAASAPSTTPQKPVAFVPLHPRNGPLWANTVPSLDADRPAHYEVMPLYTAPPTGSGEPVAWRWRRADDQPWINSSKPPSFDTPEALACWTIQPLYVASATPRSSEREPYLMPREDLEDEVLQLRRELADAYRLAVEPSRAIAAREAKASAASATPCNAEGLLPCPFCGGEPHLQQNKSDEDPQHWNWYVSHLCGWGGVGIDTRTKGGARETAIAAWNRRADGGKQTDG